MGEPRAVRALRGHAAGVAQHDEAAGAVDVLDAAEEELDVVVARAQALDADAIGQGRRR